MRLIDADALLKDGITAEYGFGDDGLLLIPMRDVINSIKIAPTVDAVPVVRCKDCKYYRYGKHFTDIKFCQRLPYYAAEGGLNTADDDFCSYGERKEGADNS